MQEILPRKISLKCCKQILHDVAGVQGHRRLPQRSRRGAGFIICAAGVFCLATEVAIPQTSTSPVLPNKPLSVSEIHIPSTLGYITETHTPVRQTASRILIHIQEAHTNVEAQRHLAQILQHLVEHYGLRLILVEGGKGDVSLSYLRRYSPLERRKRAAEKHLKLGLISGEEYFDLTSDAPILLWGVEDWDLYQEHLNAFLAIQPIQDQLAPTMASARQAIEALKPRLYGPALTDLERRSADVDRKTLGLAAYVDHLAGEAARLGVSLEPFPNVQRFALLHRLEQRMKLSDVQREQQAVFAELGRRAGKEALGALIAKGRAVQSSDGSVDGRSGSTDAESRAKFYEELQRLAQASGVSITSYPNLSAYLRYLAESRQVDPAQLSLELETLNRRVRDALITTPEGRTLAQLDEAVSLCERLVGLKLSPTEYQRVQSLFAQDSVLSHGAAFLNEQLRRDAPDAASVPSLEVLSAHWPTIRKFYELAQARDQALVDHAMAKLDETKERVAALVTGGFHGPRIAQMLRDRGVGLVVVATKISEQTDDRLYEAVVRYKSGHGTFEEVEAAAKAVSSERVSSEQSAVSSEQEVPRR